MLRGRPKRVPVPPRSTDNNTHNASGNVANLYSVRAVFITLLCCRIFSALTNIVHDCDEVFNYWEPLHFLLYGYGFQTWEYSSQYALRPYIYLLLHAFPAAPLASIFGSESGKVIVFYGVKCCLAAASALTETLLVRTTQKALGGRTAGILLYLLCTSSGLFIASTGLLPSTFTMYFLTAAAAAVIGGGVLSPILPSVVGVIWGWTVAGGAFLPYALLVLLGGRFWKAVLLTLCCAAAALVPMALVDHHFYGRWTFSLLNFVRYNVAGGGDSALYGVELPSFYFRNATNNMNLVFWLALCLPVVSLLQGGAGFGKRGWRVAVAVSPFFLWLAAITALPHKEERFLFVVYPLMCLAAACSVAALPRFLSSIFAYLLSQKAAQQTATFCLRVLLAGTALLSLSRGVALVQNYGAPMQIYRYLPPRSGGPIANVCVGDEWHRFPSSFFLPGPYYRLQFVASGFGGLLPRHFDASQGGTSAAPTHLNDRNRQEAANFWPDATRCDYFVGLQQEGETSLQGAGTGPWRTLASMPFVNAATSPALFRALWVPWLSDRHNTHLLYVLAERES